MKKASYVESRGDQSIRCTLCPHFCDLKSGESGHCQIRKNIDGDLFALTYGEIAAMAVDPIEKKPLYHFYPGSDILSIGSNGCNLRCDFCQNWHISMQHTKRETVSVDELIQTALTKKSVGIAYTYNEPLIAIEFLIECMTACRDNGLKNAIVSNGMINPEPLADVLPLIDAANIDLKGFTPGFYKSITGHLHTVKHTIQTLYSGGTHVELTHLVIPGRNDNKTDFTAMCEWIASISPDMPLHISRYFPNYQSDAPPTAEQTMIDFYDIASNILNYVYLGNIQITGCTDTHCPNCEQLMVQRSGYRINVAHRSPSCPACGTSLYWVC